VVNIVQTSASSHAAEMAETTRGTCDDDATNVGCHAEIKGGDYRALHKISHVLRTLADSLEELENFEETMEGEVGPADVDLLQIADTMRETLGKLIRNVLEVPGMQRRLETDAQVSSIQNKKNEHDCATVDADSKGKRIADDLLEGEVICGHACGEHAKVMETVVQVSSIQNKKYQHVCATVDTDFLEGEVICGHVCGKHKEVMDPRLWSMLPESLLELILARLLPYTIDGVDRLSKAWKSAVCTNAVFQGLCAQASSNMFALISYNEGGQCFDYRMFDLNSNWWRWKLYELDDGRSPLTENYGSSIVVHDGGLVCYVPDPDYQDMELQPILVHNPLTNVWKELPWQSLLGHKIVMLQLLTDNDSKFYKLMIVVYLGGGVFEAECYDSNVGIWSRMHDGFISGEYIKTERLCTFDCAKGLITNISPREFYEFRSSCTLFRDRVFALRATRRQRLIGGLLDEYGQDAGYTESDYELLEFPVDNDRLDQAGKQIHECPMAGLPFGYDVHLFSCHNFVLVIGDNRAKHEQNHHQVMRLYDMSKKVWQALPTLLMCFNDTLQDSQICELRWDAVP
jgi:hypothetical protein